VKHLLLNSSGIRDYVPLAPIHPDSVFTPENSIERVYRHQPLLFEPGANFDYSNTNFNLLGRILELSTGKSLPQLFREYFHTYAPSLRLDDGRGNYPSGYPNPWPYHWSAPGFGGGFIGSATDAMRVFCYIATQPEFKQMIQWYTPNGLVSPDAGETLLGLGIFGKSHFTRYGQAVVYEGNMGPSLMILAQLRGSIFYIATAYTVEPAKLSGLFQKLIESSLQ
jgi:CubicO group peptidase (beta-lactamase class C family)